MNKNVVLDDIFGLPARMATLRVFTSHQDLRIAGREMAKRIGVSAPTAHEALKTLFERHILNLEILGGQHIYSLNEKSRLVQKVIRPLFAKEAEFEKDLRIFLVKKFTQAGVKDKILSVVLYGSVERGEAEVESDVDIAIIIQCSKDIACIKDVVFGEVASSFFEYFGAHLDAYIKTKKDFLSLRNKNKPPVFQMLKSYRMLYGKDIREI